MPNITLQPGEKRGMFVRQKLTNPLISDSSGPELLMNHKSWLFTEKSASSVRSEAAGWQMKLMVIFLIFIINPDKANNCWAAGEPGQGTDYTRFYQVFWDHFKFIKIWFGVPSGNGN